MEIVFRHRVLMPEFPKSFGSYNFCVRRKIFEIVNGFDARYRFASGEDNDLSYKILKQGYQIYFERNALVKHVFPTRLRRYLFEQYRHGLWRVKMYRDHPHMVSGDDYTFWKDIIEPPLVLAFLTLLAVSFFHMNTFVLSVLILIALFSIQVFYGLVIAGTTRDGFALAFVMFCRSFARTFGFVAGLTNFFRKKN